MLIKYLLYIFLAVGIAPSYAQVSDLKGSSEDYKISVTYPDGWEQWGQRSSEGSIEVANNRGKKIFQVDVKDSQHYNLYEVRGENLFWITMVGDYNVDKNWSRQIWKVDLKKLKKEMIASSQDLDYRASPDGKSVVIQKNSELFLKNLVDQKEVKIASKNELGTADDFELINWSTDGKKFWFGPGCSCPERWVKLALYENSKLRWFSYTGSEEGFLEPDRGWLISSSFPFTFDVESEKQLIKSKYTGVLEVIDLYTGKKAVLGKSRDRFKPKWISPSSLEFFKGKKKVTISADKIAEAIK